MRVIVKLVCPKCKRYNYVTTKNKRTHSSRVEYKKYCPHCRERTLHKETK